MPPELRRRSRRADVARLELADDAVASRRDHDGARLAARPAHDRLVLRRLEDVIRRADAIHRVRAILRSHAHSYTAPSTPHEAMPRSPSRHEIERTMPEWPFKLQT